MKTNYNGAYDTLTKILASHIEADPKDDDFESKAEISAETNPIVKQIQVLREQMQETAQAEYAKAKIEVTKIFRELAHAITEVIHYASEAGEDTNNLQKVATQLIKLKNQANLDVSGLSGNKEIEKEDDKEPSEFNEEEVDELENTEEVEQKSEFE